MQVMNTNLKNHLSGLLILTLTMLASMGVQATDITETYTEGQTIDVPLMNRIKGAVNSKQNRVIGVCPPGQSIGSINADGTVTCEVDTDTNTNASTICAAGEYLDGSGVCHEKRPRRVGGLLSSGQTVVIADMSGEVGLNFQMTFGNLNTDNAYVHVTCAGQTGNNFNGCFAWGPGSVGPTSFVLRTSQTQVALSTTRGAIESVGTIGEFLIRNNTAQTIHYNIVIGPSQTNPN